MRKELILFTALMFASVAPASALLYSDTFTDTYEGLYNGEVVDSIGGSLYDLTGGELTVNINEQLLSVSLDSTRYFREWVNGTGDYIYSPASFLIDTGRDGSWDYAINLGVSPDHRDHGSITLYNIRDNAELTAGIKRSQIDVLLSNPDEMPIDGVGSYQVIDNSLTFETSFSDAFLADIVFGHQSFAGFYIQFSQTSGNDVLKENIPAQAVPEPATMALLGLGLVSAAGLVAGKKLCPSQWRRGLAAEVFSLRSQEH